QPRGSREWPHVCGPGRLRQSACTRRRGEPAPADDPPPAATERRNRARVHQRRAGNFGPRRRYSAVPPLERMARNGPKEVPGIPKGSYGWPTRSRRPAQTAALPRSRRFARAPAGGETRSPTDLLTATEKANGRRAFFIGGRFGPGLRVAFGILDDLA